MMKLILASKSPRRKEILSKFGFHFKVKVADFSELDFLGDPEKTAKENAFGKAKATFNACLDKDVIVIGSDTVVAIDGKILGKPKNKADAFNMLKSLSGKTHQVISGYALIGKNFEKVGFDKSLVTFNNLSDKLINEYVESGSPLDKAGAYGIQDDFPIVKSYQGSLYNVIGLPIEKISPVLNSVLKTEN
ncbi:MAG: septum formation protein Maf [Clostridia bacterium]|nr:septum formation protein Maf [Clostridia bacterium]